MNIQNKGGITRPKNQDKNINESDYSNPNILAMNTPIIERHIDGQFSFFEAPINNIKPNEEINLRAVYNAITGNRYKERTEHLRSLTDPKAARLFKKQNFDCVTFAGKFHTRKDEALITPSGLLCMGIDCRYSNDVLFERLLHDQRIETQLLFRSASGHGVKWVIKTDPAAPFHDFALAVLHYVRQAYKGWRNGYVPNVSCACFLPFDPQAFINPKLR